MTIISAYDHSIIGGGSDALLSLELTDCGVVKSMSGETLFAVPDYVLIYMKNGKGELSASSRTVFLETGEFIICRPYEQKSLTLLDQMSEVFWFSFHGRMSTELLSLLKLTAKDKCFIGHDAEINSLFKQIVAEHNKFEPNSEIITSALLIALLGLLSRTAVHLVPQSQIKGQEKIAPALDSINSDCTSNISVDEYAKMCNLSTSYFTHLFTSITGFSPMEYKQLQRMNIAKNLLSTTNLTIKEISGVIGFKDPLYFGRCFKQLTGQTPSAFRGKK